MVIGPPHCGSSRLGPICGQPTGSACTMRRQTAVTICMESKQLMSFDLASSAGSASSWTWTEWTLHSRILESLLHPRNLTLDSAPIDSLLHWTTSAQSYRRWPCVEHPLGMSQKIRYIVSMLGRCWPNIKPALSEYLVFSGVVLNKDHLRSWTVREHTGLTGNVDPSLDQRWVNVSC